MNRLKRPELNRLLIESQMLLVVLVLISPPIIDQFAYRMRLAPRLITGQRVPVQVLDYYTTITGQVIPDHARVMGAVLADHTMSAQSHFLIGFDAGPETARLLREKPLWAGSTWKPWVAMSEEERRQIEGVLWDEPSLNHPLGLGRYSAWVHLHHSRLEQLPGMQRVRLAIVDGRTGFIWVYESIHDPIERRAARMRMRSMDAEGDHPDDAGEPPLRDRGRRHRPRPAWD